MQLNQKNILKSLDKYQREAVTAISGPVAIIAGAGTGKTRTIIHRIAYGIINEGWEPESVLAVTFTAKATAEMRERLEQLGIEGVNVHTFHAAALRQMWEIWPKVAGTDAPMIDTDKIRHILDAAKKLEISITNNEASLISDEISWAKVSMLSPQEYIRASIDNHREAVYRFGTAVEGARTISKLYDEYDTIKSDRNRIDFDDVMLLVIYILNENKSIGKTISERYEHIIVDEYQDVSPLQQELLDCWLGDSDELCVVGDPSQTIYSFTGASPRFLLNFKEKYEDAKVVKLINDYRSSDKIVSLANEVLNYVGKEGFSPLKLVSNSLTQNYDIEWKEYETDEEQASEVVKEIVKLHNQGNHLDDIAVLFRTNSQAQCFADVLKKEKVPYYVKLDKSSGEDEPIISANKAPSGVILASLHSAKGLEWETVFLVGLSDGLMPLSRAKGDEAIEEERRLLYVGITRAKERLYMSYAKAKQEGSTSQRVRSRFLDYIWPA